MVDPDYGPPLFGLIENFEEREAALKKKVKAAQREKSRFKRKCEQQEERYEAKLKRERFRSDALREELTHPRDELRRLQSAVTGYQRDCTNLRQEIKKRDQDNVTEREKLAAWIDRRIAQQEPALTAKFLSSETQKLMEVEVAVLKRYREYVLEGAHSQGTDDPFMPKFA